MDKTIVRRTCGSAGLLPESLHPVLRRVYSARGIASAEQLDYSLKRLCAFDDLSGIAAAVGLLAEAVTTRQRMLVVGDFDADGATSSAVAVLGLRALGAANVGYLVPNRFEFGYGLTPEIVAVAARLQPHLLVTVDNGIASREGVEAAHRLGMRVLITDHHLPGAGLPPADAIVNPNLPGDGFPSKHLAGVGVMFYVLLALRAHFRERAWFSATDRPEPNLAALLDLVALGTVADLVPLDHNNRILVHQGLARIRAGQCRPGIKALIEIAGRDRRWLSAADLGFALAPRLNAAGRLTDMSLGIECLLCEDESIARRLAQELDALNRQRREIESAMQAQALDALPQIDGRWKEGDLPSGLCLFHEEWHQGVIGILAARVRERVHRPVVAFAAGLGEEIKGSARSVPGVHVRDVLEAVATAQPGLITKFGGHAMAAGVTLKRGDFDAFRLAFAAEIDRRVSADTLRGVVYSDGELLPHELCFDLAEGLRRAGPWGQGFAEPLFDGEFEVLAKRIVGDKHLKLTVRPSGGPELNAMGFNFAGGTSAEAGERLRLAYRLDVNEYQGRRSPQLIIEHALPTVSVLQGASKHVDYGSRQGAGLLIGHR
jgi:single-stranded-DNA-specific exonuclease